MADPLFDNLNERAIGTPVTLDGVEAAKAKEKADHAYRVPANGEPPRAHPPQPKTAEEQAKERETTEQLLKQLGISEAAKPPIEAKTTVTVEHHDGAAATQKHAAEPKAEAHATIIHEKADAPSKAAADDAEKQKHAAEQMQMMMLMQQLEQQQKAAEQKQSEATTSHRYGEEAIETQEAKKKEEKPNPAKNEKLNRTLVTIGVIVAIAAVGFFIGGPLLGPVFGQIANGVGLAMAHAGAAFEGLFGVAALSAPVASMPLAGSIAGATALGVGAHVTGVTDSITNAITGHETHTATSAAHATGLEHGYDAYSADASNQMMSQKVATKASQYSMEHEHYSAKKAGDKSWATRAAPEGGYREKLQSTGSHAEAVGKRSAASVTPRQSNFSEELDQSRQLQEMLGAPAR